MKRKLFAVVMAMIGWPAQAHHGVASLGAVGLEGPGAPVETSSSATLPEGGWLVSMKVDHAKSKTGITPAPDDNAEGDYNQYWMLGLGYGVRPWLSVYAFQPYNIKIDEPDGQDSLGFTDLSVAGVVGFKYDEGFRLVPVNESLDDLMDWHFTAYAGASLPTGDANHRLDDGSIDPGKSLGFGKSSFNYGLTATKQLNDADTIVFEAGQIRFQTFEYDDGNRVRFGAETRLNAAWAHKLMADPVRKLRLDSNLELNFLRLGRDVENDVGAEATGGDMLYGVVGARLYKDNFSIGLALKKPFWTDLNEESLQQGAEGKEKYRLIATLSALF
jgi:hypothetical protein